MPKIIENLRENILAEAAVLLQQGGVEGVSIRAVSQRLHIAPATIYNYFESKEQIIGEIIVSRWRLFLAEADRIAGRADGDVLMQLEALGLSLRAFMQPAFAPWLMAGRASLGAERLEHIHDKKQMVFDQLCMRVATVLRNGGHDEATAAQNAPVLTRLLILCSHDHQLELRTVVAACRSLDIAKKEA